MNSAGYIAGLLSALDAEIFESRATAITADQMPAINVIETSNEIEPPLIGGGRLGKSEIEISIFTRDMDDGRALLSRVSDIIEQTPHPYKSLRVQQVEQIRNSNQDREFILTKINLNIVYEY